ncbi:MAG TPA: glycosyltransferase, partial [Phototrophicaceae bacterium]|nr:glycosyltransferase [Phototrophicaceae bacterium]
MPNQDLTGMGVCWLGNMRYTNPLNRTAAKKWQALSHLGLRMYVLGFATAPRFQLFTQFARFYLLPELPLAFLRYFEFFLLTPPLLLWLVLRRRVSVIVAVSPFEGAVAALVKNMAGLFGQPVALVVESHGDFEVAVFQQRRIRLAGLYRRLMAGLTRYALRYADVLRTVSNSSRQQLAAWSPKNQPMHQFMAWTDFSAFANLEREKSLLETQVIVYV